jgi:ADP-sugar diphosphatase
MNCFGCSVIKIEPSHEFEITTNNYDVKISFPQILAAPKFQNWLQQLDTSILDIDHIRIDHVKWFCNPANPDPAKLGFLYLEVIAKEKQTNKTLPGIVFLRGNAVAVLIYVNVGSEEYIIFTEQTRVPIGRKILEIPAGMMDDSSNFAGVAMKEISEETGLKAPHVNDLKFLGKIIPSAGGCDEEISLFFWKTSVSMEKKDEILSKIHGNSAENESIKILFIQKMVAHSYLLQIGDVKGISAWMYASDQGYI